MNVDFRDTLLSVWHMQKDRNVHFGVRAVKKYSLIQKSSENNWKNIQ